MTKNVDKQKCFSVITKNSNWEILTKNLVTFKMIHSMELFAVTCSLVRSVTKTTIRIFSIMKADLFNHPVMSKKHTIFCHKLSANN